MPTAEEVSLSLAKYIELVDRCARKRLDYPIPNESPQHARVLIAKLFETARRSVVIVSGQLTDKTSNGIDVYGEKTLVANAKNFLRRPNSKLQIVLVNPIHLGEENRLLKAVTNDRERKGELILFPGKNSKRSGKRTNERSALPHFMVTDALAYRYEQDDQRIKAVANFGDPKTASKLRELFEEIVEYISSERAQQFTFEPGDKFEIRTA